MRRERGSSIDGVIKRCLLLALLFAASARAEWCELKEGADTKSVLACIGAPLLMNKSRNGRQITWTYDNGGYVMFANGRVTFWSAPRATSKPLAKL